MTKTKRIAVLITVMVMMFTAFGLCPSASAVTGAKTVKNSKNYSKSNTVYFKYNAKYSKLTAKTAAAKKVNKYIKKLAKSGLSNNKKFAQEQFDNGYTTMMPYYLKYDIKLVNNKNGIYSFKSTVISHLGGAHPNIAVTGYNFSKKTGKKLSNSKLTKYSNSVLKKKIVSKVKKEIEKTPERFFNDALETVKNTKINKFDCWRQGSKLHVFFNNYVLSTWAAGPTEITIKL